jgi:hypothetical protein
MLYRRQYLGDFHKAQRAHPDWPVVLSEGDSWFSYADVIGRLDDPGDQGPQNQRAWALLRLEKAGDEILTILSGAQRSRLRDIFQRWSLNAVLFSGGGNDIIGPDLLPLLRPYSDGMQAPDLVAFSRFERRLRQIQDCYRELLDLLSDAGQIAKIFVNSYDYLVPSDRPVKLFGIVNVAGPWLLPALNKRSIPESLHKDVVALLIDSFVAAVKAVAAEPRGAGRLILVDNRNVVGSDWKDEIHPARQGAKRVAAAFEKALRSENVIA